MHTRFYCVRDFSKRVGVHESVVGGIRRRKIREFPVRPVKVPSINDQPAYRSAVPTHKLCKTVDNDISAEVDRSAQNGCGCSAVDDKRNIVLMCYLSDRFDIKNVQARIAEGFTEKCLRLIVDACCIVIWIGRVYQMNFDAHSRQRRRKKRVRAPIELRCGDDLISWPCDIEN